MVSDNRPQPDKIVEIALKMFKGMIVDESPVRTMQRKLLPKLARRNRREEPAGQAQLDL